MATIRYFLPEDGDSEETPNVFLAPKPTRPGYPPALGQIKRSFPLPGNYHFRFKTALVPGTDRDKNAVAVWMDCMEDDEPVPVWQGSIITRVTRTGIDDGDDLDDDFDRDISRASSNVSTSGYSAASPTSVQVPSQPKPVQEVPASASHSTDSLLGAFDDTPAPAAPAATTSSAHSSTGNLLDVDHAPAPASGGSLLDIDGMGTGGGYHASGTNTPNSDHAELLNMSAPIPSPHHAPPAQGMPTQMQYQQQQHLQQHSMQRQQTSMQGQYPGQYAPQGHYGQQGMGQMGGQQHQRGQPPRPGSSNNSANGSRNAFDSFSSSNLDPLGNLKWS
mmetsp:Transcript_27564/g.57883  ORF Transcript_27564/g.57883 Transcript_27564/m.57883 type:complete len:332 (+) Transcript_27564:106-1101(+)|eukprot:CAMPEP_0171329048 /NCGR_PEP_ID=MMETSP0878-20121228/991_1 /TAXON_ID=67004 /ORGANISM="Thalassiosira weissflogii, Strain CCMP1336" /LENGTH=331 /DNA_ID=CAMNT_0011828941 /DNA_START=42 /DNA_END=1037 /DNA_ORIENTATION=+